MVYFYEKLCGFILFQEYLGQCVAATAAKVCSEELSMLEQNTKLGSMKKDLILSTLTISRSM